MKSRAEIRERLESLFYLRDRMGYGSPMWAIYQGKITALQWVLGMEEE